MEIMKNVQITNTKTGSTTYGDVEYYQNARTGKMMFSAKCYSQLKPVYWIAKNCTVKNV